MLKLFISFLFLETINASGKFTILDGKRKNFELSFIASVANLKENYIFTESERNDPSLRDRHCERITEIIKKNSAPDEKNFRIEKAHKTYQGDKRIFSSSRDVQEKFRKSKTASLHELSIITFSEIYHPFFDIAIRQEVLICKAGKKNVIISVPYLNGYLFLKFFPIITLYDTKIISFADTNQNTIYEIDEKKHLLDIDRSLYTKKTYCLGGSKDTDLELLKELFPDECLLFEKWGTPEQCFPDLSKQDVILLPRNPQTQIPSQESDTQMMIAHTKKKDLEHMKQLFPDEYSHYEDWVMPDQSFPDSSKRDVKLLPRKPETQIPSQESDIRMMNAHTNKKGLKHLKQQLSPDEYHSNEKQRTPDQSFPGFSNRDVKLLPRKPETQIPSQESDIQMMIAHTKKMFNKIGKNVMKQVKSKETNSEKEKPESSGVKYNGKNVMKQLISKEINSEKEKPESSGVKYNGKKKKDMKKEQCCSK